MKLNDDLQLFAQRSLFKKSDLGFPVDLYETDLLLVIINILVPNTTPGIINPLAMLLQIVGDSTVSEILKLVSKLREVLYFTY